MGKRTLAKQEKIQEQYEAEMRRLKGVSALSKMEKKNSKKYDHNTFYHYIAKFGGYTIRNPEDWKCTFKNKDKARWDFIRHCFVKYNVPSYLYPICNEPAPPNHWQTHVNNQNKVFDKLFFIITKGGSAYKEFFKEYNVSKKEAVHFITKGKNDCSPLENLLRTKVFVNGGNDKLFNIFRIKMGHFTFEYITNNAIIHLINFFMKNIELVTKDNFGDMFDAIRAENIDLKGRTWQSVVKLSNEYHHNVQLKKVSGEWEPMFGNTAIYVKEYDTPNASYIKPIYFIELVNADELKTEGNKQNHCVAGYVFHCVQNRSRIISMRETKHAPIITIELNCMNNSIVQARGKYNRQPTKEEGNYIKTWAKLNNLSISRYVLQCI